MPTIEFRRPTRPTMPGTLTVKGNRIIDALMDPMITIEDACKRIPRGAFIHATSPYRDIYERKHTAERQIAITTDFFPGLDVTGLVRAARKWYEKGQWQTCLPDACADRLFLFFYNPPRGGW
jgi:hypothetical protein